MKRWFSHPELRLRTAQALLESLWVYICVRMVASMAAPPVGLSFVAIAGLLVSAMLGTGWIERLAVRLEIRRLLALPLAAAGLLTCWMQGVIMGAPPVSFDQWLTVMTTPWWVRSEVDGLWPLALWLLASYLVGRGILIGLRTAGADVTRGFMVGASAIVVLIAGFARTSIVFAPATLAELRGLLLAYFVFGIVAMVSVQRESVYARARIRPRESRVWLAAIAVPILFVAAIGTTVGICNEHLANLVSEWF